MNQPINAGDYVKLLYSSNPYVPKGTIVKIESLSSIIDKDGICQVFNCTFKGRKYIVHKECIKKMNFIAPEKVDFT